MSTQINEIPKVFQHGETLESAELNAIISQVNQTIRKINTVETNLNNHSYDVSIPITNIYCRTKKGVNAINFFPQADAKRDELLEQVSECSITQGIKYNTNFSTVTLSDNADLMNGIWTAYPQGVNESLPHEWEVSYKKLADNSIMYMFGPVLRSNYGYSGADGDGVQYVYRVFNHELSDIERTNNTPIRPENPNVNGEFIPSGWFDDPQGPTAEYPYEYVSTLKRTNGSWGNFEKISLWSTYAEDGTNGDFQVRAFCRFIPTSNKLAPNKPIGGEYNSPQPGSNDNIQWSLTIPPEDANNKGPVWTSTKVFKGTGQETEWSTPAIEADSAELDIEYSSSQEKPDPETTLRKVPKTPHPSTGIWHDPSETNIDLSAMVWRAERKIKNGQYDGEWVITKIAGQKGSFKSMVFRRFKPTMQQSSPATPVGGTYDDPLPDGGLWFDGIPSGDSKTDGPVWASTKIFYDDGTQTVWSTPQLQTDSEDLDIEFSPNENQPDDPKGEPFSNREADGWYDSSSANFNTAGPMIWRAERKVSQGQYVGGWTVTRIYGEKGEPGFRGDFVSRVFCRSSVEPPIPEGGDYDDPLPTNEDLSGNKIWSDGIPATGPGTIYTSYRKFYGNPAQEESDGGTWSIPTVEADSNTLDIEYSTSTTEPDPRSLRSVPEGEHDASYGINWYDPSETQYIPVDPSTGLKFPIIWRAERKISGTQYEGNWIITRILGEKGPEGKRGSFKSCVFKRSNDVLNGFSSAGDNASYDDPVPRGTGVFAGWSDGIPEGDEALWMAVSRFTGIGNEHSDWTVTQQTDSTTLDVEFSPGEGPNHTCPLMDLISNDGNTVFTHPINNYEPNRNPPKITQDREDRNTAGWWDSSQLDENSPTMVWRAERKINGLQQYEGNWVVTRINGENGKNAVFLTLDNEHEDFLYNDAGILIAPSNGATSQVRLYEGGTEMTPYTSWEISDNEENWGTNITSNNFTANINSNTGLLTVTGIYSNSAKVKIRGLYNETYYFAEFTANKTNQDKYDLIINPNAIAYNPSSFSPQNITLNVKRTDLQGTSTNLSWGAYINNSQTNRSIVSTTEDKGFLRMFIYLYKSVQGGYDVIPVRQLSSTFTANSENINNLDSFRIELRKYNNPEDTDGNTYTIVDYENIEIAKVENGNSGASAVNIVCTPASLIVNQSLDNSDDLDNITSNNTFNVTIYKGEEAITPQRIDFEVEKVNNKYTSEFTVNGSENPSSKGSITGGVLTLKKILKNGDNYYETSTVQCSAVYRDGLTDKYVPFTVVIYANLLGTWGESVKGSIKQEIATSKMFDLDSNGNIKESNYLGNFIRSSKENTSRLEEETFIKVGSWNSQTVTLSQEDLDTYGNQYRLSFNMETDEEDVKVNFAGVTKEIKSYNTFKETYGISSPGAYGISISKKSDNSAISPTISNLALYAVGQSKFSQISQTVDSITSTVKGLQAGKNLITGALTGSGWRVDTSIPSGWNHSGGAAVTVDDNGYITRSGNSGYLCKKVTVQRNTQYTLSYYPKTSDSSELRIYFSYGDSDTASFTTTHSSGTTRRSYTFTTSSGTGSLDIYIAISTEGLKNPQLEVGDSATVFEASTSELQSQVYSKIQQTANSISLETGVSEQRLNQAGLSLTAGDQANNIPSKVRISAGQFEVYVPGENNDPDEIIFGNDPYTHNMSFSGDIKVGYDSDSEEYSGIIRQDGSGYLAFGHIYWTADGDIYMGSEEAHDDSIFTKSEDSYDGDGLRIINTNQGTKISLQGDDDMNTSLRELYIHSRVPQDTNYGSEHSPNDVNPLRNLNVSATNIYGIVVSANTPTFQYTFSDDLGYQVGYYNTGAICIGNRGTGVIEGCRTNVRKSVGSYWYDDKDGEKIANVDCCGEQVTGKYGKYIQGLRQGIFIKGADAKIYRAYTGEHNGGVYLNGLLVGPSGSVSDTAYNGTHSGAVNDSNDDPTYGIDGTPLGVALVSYRSDAVGATWQSMQ